MNYFRKLAFTFWYTRKPPWDTNQIPSELLAFINSNLPGRALDLGCGTGTNVIALAKSGWDATGIDFIYKAIRVARKKADESGVTAKFKRMDVTRIHKLKDHFDLILDMGCYHSLDRNGMQKYRRGLKNLLAPDGTFLLYTFIDCDSNRRRAGLTDEDLYRFQNMLSLIKRVDGNDKVGSSSAWLYFKKLI